MSRRRLALGLCLCLLALAGGPVPLAHSELVRAAGGHLIGVTPHRGIAPTAVPGALASGQPGLSALAQATTPGTLTYHSGPVMHSSAPYLIYWTPAGESVPSSTQGLLSRYFTDVAADNGTAANVYAVARQFTDGAGFADYSQSFSPGQVLTDTAAYPARDTTNCPRVASAYPVCITDTQLQAEVARELSAAGLPADGSASASTLPADAPVYFVVLPTNVNLCYTAGGQVSCADDDFCAYHSSFASGGQTVLYSAIPTVVLGAGQNPKSCQWDNTTPVQEPNGTPADVVLKYLSHEDSETITDPTWRGWYDGTSGFENGDMCNAYGTADPTGGTSPNAFAPVLGGSASGGTLYNQLINHHDYYLQSEWSNGDGACELRPTSGTVSPSFTIPLGTSTVGSTLSFSPLASSSTNYYSSATWNFGDGTTAFSSHAGSMSSVSHAYTSAGNYTVSLTLVDTRGNLATTTKRIPVYDPPLAVFSTTNTPAQGVGTKFDASASSDPDPGVVITTYAWNFGDGGTATGVTPAHVYKAAGTYNVTLTVTNSVGLSSTVTQPVSVADEPPSAFLSITTATPGSGQPTSFDASASSDPDGTVSSYAWDFGDGTSGTGATPSHTYQAPGTYTVTVAVTDSDGQTATVSHPVLVAGPSPSFTWGPTVEGGTMTVDGSASSDAPSGSTIVAYTWNWGDGTTVSGPSPSASHQYSGYGVHWVTLTLTDSAGFTSSLSRQVTVADEAPAPAFSVLTASPGSGLPTAFDASASSDPDGTVVGYGWSFGDGTSAAGAAPSHVYLAPGSYTVTLTITDSDGGTAQSTQTVTVTGPTASFAAPAGGVESSPVSFDGSGSSTGPGGPPLGYAWDFGDGATAQGPTPSHTYTSAGTYNVTLTVTDALGQSDAVTHPVVVADEQPSAGFAIAPGAPVASTVQPVAFNAAGSTDPDGRVTGYAWQFGDGSTGAGPTPTHLYSSPGLYTISLSVSDSNGQHSPTVSRQLVVHAPPTAAFSLSTPQPTERFAVTFNGGASTDPEAGVGVSAYRWSFGDGSTAGGITATHAFSGPGTYAVTLTVSNTLGLTATTVQQVSVAADPVSAAFTILGASPAAGQTVRFSGAGSVSPVAPIAAYRWSFGDGGTGTGPTPLHAYRAAGRYRVTLTITDAGGTSSSVTGMIVVASPPRITRLAVRTAADAVMLLVSVNGPGRVLAGGRRVSLQRAGTAQLKLRLSGAVEQALASGHPNVRMSTAVVYQPLSGRRITHPVTVVLRALRRAHRFAAVLARG